jgi:hypothetical protein
MFESRVVIGVQLMRRVRTRATHVGRPSRQEALLQDSFFVHCVMIGTPGQRCYAKCTMATRPAMEARRLLSHAIVLLDCSEHVCVNSAILGMAAFFGLVLCA